MMEGLSKMTSKSGNSVHGPFNLAAVQSTNTHIVDANICTYESSSNGPFVLDVGENTTYTNLFNSRVALEVRITLASGDDCPPDGDDNLIPGEEGG